MDPAALCAARRERCIAMGVDLLSLDRSAQIALDCPRPLVGIVSSRVGHEVARHRSMSRQIAASMERILRGDETLLIAEGTAAEPWVTHAASVFHVSAARIAQCDDRDRLLIAIADRVDAVYVRRGGKVTSLLRQRARLRCGLVRVAIDSSGAERETVWDLLRAGVVGCYLPAEREPAELDAKPVGRVIAGAHVDWSSYLVHCTRSAAGPWPGQTWAQYRDDLLLADSRSAARDCIDALCRIVHKQRLVAGAIGSRRETPVVCFSAVPLPELLARRVYRSHLHRWDYEPFGIAIARRAAVERGMQPVVYARPSRLKDFPQDQRYRFQSSGSTYDWTAEQEWRSASDIDLRDFAPSEGVIFVPDCVSAMRVDVCNRNRWPIAVLTT